MTRADVLMFFPPQRDANGNPTGRRLVNDMDLLAAGEPLTTVRLPERGTGNQTPQSAGATILMVYRDPAEPLRKIVVYRRIARSGAGRNDEAKAAWLSSVLGLGASSHNHSNNRQRRGEFERRVDRDRCWRADCCRK